MIKCCALQLPNTAVVMRSEEEPLPVGNHSDHDRPVFSELAASSLDVSLPEVPTHADPGSTGKSDGTEVCVSDGHPVVSELAGSSLNVSSRMTEIKRNIHTSLFIAVDAMLSSVSPRMRSSEILIELPVVCSIVGVIARSGDIAS